MQNSLMENPPTFRDYASWVNDTTCADGFRYDQPCCEISDLVTIITVAFNSAKTIARTLESISAQTYPCIEHIIIDGGSTDGTLALLRETSASLACVVSEPDRGISDAFNKGIALSRGKYIALVNSDDWLDREHIALAVAALKSCSADFVFGDLMLHPAGTDPAYVLRGDPHYAKLLHRQMPQLNHPSVVSKRGVYEAYGLFNTRLAAAMDFEWFLRGLRQGVTGAYVPGMVSHMTMEGVSHHNYRQGLREVRDVSVLYGYPRLLAQLRYVIRVTRVRTRLALQRFMPRRLFEILRRFLNPHYRRTLV